MDRRQNSLEIAAALLIVAFACSPPVITHLRNRSESRPNIRRIEVRARQYAFSPSVIRVTKGDRVHLRLISLDVVHGFFLEGHDIDAKIEPGTRTIRVRRPSVGGTYEATDEIVFTAERTGKFRFRCSQTCGYLHPFMQGELIVTPNILFSFSTHACIGLLAGGWFFGLCRYRRKKRSGESSPSAGNSSDHHAENSGNGPAAPRRTNLLEKVPLLKWFFQRRWFQASVVLPNFLVFTMFLLAGFFGTPVGNRNISIIFVWILWWFLLISILVPFGSRVWCMVCPFPFLGEWVQRGALLYPRNKTERVSVLRKNIGRNSYFGLNLSWPKKISNIWLQNIGFLLLCTFSTLLLTRPVVSALVLMSLLVMAFVLSLIFKQRAFCKYICPVGGFLSLFSMTSLIEVRSKEGRICAQCATKGCFTGNERGWGCPWFLFPSKLDRNNYCGMCMECLKSCPHDNMTVFLRPFCSDRRLTGFDEAWKAFIMLTLAGAYSLVFLGPWGLLKDITNVTESGKWLSFGVYALSLWSCALVLMPLTYAGAIALGRMLGGSGGLTWKRTFLGMVYPLAPLGLFVWIGFSVPLIFVNGSYILNTLSDPFGWGWNLFGTAHFGWQPFVPHSIPYLQAVFLVAGFSFVLRIVWVEAGKLAGAASRGALCLFIPVSAWVGLVVIGFLKLFTG